MRNNQFISVLIAMLMTAGLAGAPAWAQEEAAAPVAAEEAAQPADGAAADGAADAAAESEAPIDPKEAKRREREAKQLARENKKRATELTKSSKKALAAKRFDDAIAALTEANQLDPQPERIFHLAVAYHLRSTEYETAGQYQESYEVAQKAYELYQTFLAAEKRGRQVEEARQYAIQLKVELDKEELRRTRERELKQSLETAEQARAAEQAEAQAARDEARKARQELEDAKRAAAQTATERDSRRATGPQVAAGSGAGRGKRTLGAVMMVSGGLGLGAALAYGLAASRAESELEGADPWPEGGNLYHSFADSAASRQLYLGIAGAVLTTGGALVYYLGERDTRQPARLENRNLAITPAVGAQSAGVQVSGRF